MNAVIGSESKCIERTNKSEGKCKEVWMIMLVIPLIAITKCLREMNAGE